MYRVSQNRVTYYRLIAYMSITYEQIFKHFLLSDCRMVKLYSKMLVVVLRRFYVKKKIDKPAQIQALNSTRKKRHTFPVNISDVIQKENTNSLKHIFLDILQNVSKSLMEIAIFNRPNN